MVFGHTHSQFHVSFSLSFLSFSKHTGQITAQILSSVKDPVVIQSRAHKKRNNRLGTSISKQLHKERIQYQAAQPTKLQYDM